MAVTDELGRYTLKYNRQTEGAKMGRHMVRISTFVPDETDDDGKLVQPGISELVHPQYSAQAPLTAEVKRGGNEIDFPLTRQSGQAERDIDRHFGGRSSIGGLVYFHDNQPQRSRRKPRIFCRGGVASNLRRLLGQIRHGTGE